MTRVLDLIREREEIFYANVSYFSGKKVCLHLHGVFPYLLVKSPTDETRYGEQLAQSLDMAINVALERGDAELKHVYDIHLVELL